VGIGTYTASGTTLSRDTVLSSSNGGSLVNFSAGTKDVWVDYPAGRAVYENEAGNVDGFPITGGTINNTVIGGTTPAAGTFTTLTATGQANIGTGLARSIVAAGSASGSPGIYSTGSSLIFSGGASSGTGLYSNLFLQLQLNVPHTASAVNFLQATGAATGSGPVFSAQGSDTNINLNLATKGTGVFDVNMGLGKVFSATDHPATAGGAIVNFTRAFGSQSGYSVGVMAQGSDANIPFIISSRGNQPIGFWTNSVSQQQFIVSHTASAVNFVQVTGAVTTGAPVISSQGSDSNVPLSFLAKGAASIGLANSATVGAFGIELAENTTVDKTTFIDFHSSAGTDFDFRLARQGGVNNFTTYVNAGTGGHAFQTAGGVEQLRVSHTASAVNFVQVTGAATGSAPVVAAQGSDANIVMRVASKGTQVIAFSTNYAGSGTGNTQVLVSHTANAVNFWQLTGSATGAAPVLSVQGSDTNIPAVVQPKGTGALQAQQTDSTATGGNARGANAVDWQTSRTAASQVASGQYATIGGGYRGTASGFATTISGGEANTSSGFISTVGGGASNTASGTYATIAGGYLNTNTRDWSFVGSGYANTAVGYHNFIGAGFSNSGTANAAVTTQATTAVTSGSTAVTLSGSNASIRVGQLITGTGINSFPNTYVAAISGTSLTLSQNAVSSGTPTLSFFTPHGVVVGGGNNQATGSYSFIGGGGDAGTAASRNVASGDWSVVAGGRGNIASGNGAFVGGGGFFTGAGNAATGTLSFIGGGRQNQASGTESCVIGGVANTANGTVSTVLGGRTATTRGITGNIVGSASESPIGGTGSAQFGILVLGRQTTDATPTVLTSSESAAGTTNQVILPNNSAYFFRGEVVSGVTGGGNTKGWTIEGVIKRGAGAASTTLVGTPTVTSSFADAGASTWTIAVTADTTNGGLAVTFTGQAATTIRCVAKIETTEMTF
jgi:hypothetical protein